MTPCLLAAVNLHWYLPPVVLAVSLVYGATRYEDWGLIWRFSARWVLYILSFLGGTYIALWLLFRTLDENNYWYAVPVVIVALYLFGPSWKRKPKKTDAQSG